MRQTDYVILGLLSELPLTGYQIKKLIDARFRFFWSESFGQIFPALKTLAANHSIEEIVGKGKRNRSQKAYRITGKGLDELGEWLKRPVERESIRLEILLKMYFSNLVDARIMLAHIIKFKQAHEEELRILDLFQKELEEIMNLNENHPLILRVIDFGQKTNQAYLAWSLDTIEFLERRMTHETKNP
jgi:PadR family transcriptional regulator, regulatory protein AphA